MGLGNAEFNRLWQFNAQDFNKSCQIAVKLSHFFSFLIAIKYE